MNESVVMTKPLELQQQRFIAHRSSRLLGQERKSSRSKESLIIEDGWCEQHVYLNILSRDFKPVTESHAMLVQATHA